MRYGSESGRSSRTQVHPSQPGFGASGPAGPGRKPGPTGPPTGTKKFSRGGITIAITVMIRCTSVVIHVRALVQRVLLVRNWDAPVYIRMQRFIPRPKKKHWFENQLILALVHCFFFAFCFKSITRRVEPEVELWNGTRF